MKHSQEMSLLAVESVRMNEMMDFINLVEKEFPVSDWTVEGIRVWPLVRWHLGWSFYPASETASNGKPSPKALQAAKAALGTFIPYGLTYLADFRNNSRPDRPADVFFLSYTTARQVTAEGKAFDVVCDPLISLLEGYGKKSLVWEYAPANEYRIPRHSPSFFAQPALFLVYLRSRMTREKEADEAKLDGYFEFLAFLRRNRIDSFRYLDIHLLKKDVHYLRLIANGYQKELRKIKPLLVFSSDCGIYEYALNLACRESGVVSIEVQHGLQGDLHFGYGRWQKVPAEGYELLPRFYWCWDRDSAEAINEWAQVQCPEAHEAIVGGNAWLGLWLKGEDSWVRFYDHKLVQLKKTVAMAKKHILITLQSPEKTCLKGELISEFVLEAMKTSPHDWFWWVRLHPTMMKSKPLIKRLLERYEIRHFDMDQATRFPLPALLRHVDVHLTHSSSVVLDAEAFGVPSVVWSSWGEEFYRRQLQTGMAKSAHTSSDLIAAIQSQFDVKGEPKEGARVNVRAALEFLLTAADPLKREYRQCARCVLDTFVPDITFDSEGVCHYCRSYDKVARQFILIDERVKKEKLDRLVSKIKASEKGKPCDSIVGLSGGTDSSYLVYLAHRLGLRPLVVHFDNGWNSEVAVRNVYHIVKKLNLDLYTFVINWEEFKDLQRSYLKASVVDIEVPTDQLIMGSLYRIALKKGIKYILDGCNIVTEHVMPTGWNYPSKLDPVNLKNIHKRFGTVKLKNFPELGFFRKRFYRHILGLQAVSLLDYVPYVRQEAKEILKKELEWQDYGGKHYESMFTRFYQGYILPQKFGIDKRKAHFSNLICSGQMTKKEALSELEREPYPVEQQLADKEYVIKKLGFTEAEFDAIMRLPVRDHREFGSENENLKYLRFFAKKIFRLFNFVGPRVNP